MRRWQRSFIHYTLVGHFDARTVSPRNLACARPIDLARVTHLLAEYPAAVTGQVTVENGYARCQWAPGGGVSDLVFEFAYRLAREEACLAVENGRQVVYPPGAARAQAEVWERVAGRVGFADEAEQRARVQAKAQQELEKQRRRARSFSRPADE